MALQSSGLSVYQEKTATDAESLLKDQCIKFLLYPLTRGSSRVKAEQARDTWGASGADGSGDRTEGTTARIPEPSHSPYCRSHLWRGGRPFPSRQHQPEGEQ